MTRVGRVGSSRPEAVVTTMVAVPSPQLKRDASLTVVVFGRVGYTRSASDASAFDAELACWHWAPPILAVVAGAVGGYAAGHFGGRWLARPRRAPDAEPDRRER